MFLCLLCLCVYTCDIMKRLLPLLALLAFVTVYANQQRVKISPGFFTGKDYLDMSDTEQRAYTTGEINGMLVAPFFGAPEENLNWLKRVPGKCRTSNCPRLSASSFANSRIKCRQTSTW